jgi:Na+-transporting NADH:ubiquinone oxidoreductase subunit NqrF
MKFFTAKKNTDEKKEEGNKTESTNSETEVKEKQQDKKKLEIGKFGFGPKKEKQDASHMQNEQSITSEQDEIKKIEPESAVKSTGQSKKSDSSFENTSVTSTEMIKKLVPEISKPFYYICGPTIMVEETAKLLKRMGIEDSKIKLERFG